MSHHSSNDSVDDEEVDTSSDGINLGEIHTPAQLKSDYFGGGDNSPSVLSSSSSDGDLLKLEERIPLLFNHKIYRFNTFKNVYEQVSDAYALTGWRHMYIGVQHEDSIICISVTTGCIYRKMIRSNKYNSEEQSMLIADGTDPNLPVWNDTRVMIHLDNRLYLLLSDRIYQLKISGNGSNFSFLKMADRKALGPNWKRNCFAVYNRAIYGVDEQSGRILCYEFDSDFTNIVDDGGRRWDDCCGMVVLADDKLLLFTSGGAYHFNPTNAQYSIVGREEKWSLHNGCVCQVDESTVIFLHLGCVFRWDLFSNQYTLLQKGWRICNLVIPFKPIDHRDHKFLSFGSSSAR